MKYKINRLGYAIVKQENSYYAFGLVMPNSPVMPLAVPNKNLCNRGSEWQNDFGKLPDYYQTYFRNYDVVLGRFIGVDPNPATARVFGCRKPNVVKLSAMKENNPLRQCFTPHPRPSPKERESVKVLSFGEDLGEAQRGYFP